MCMHTSRVQRESTLNDTEGLITMRRLHIRRIQLSETTSWVYIYSQSIWSFASSRDVWHAEVISSHQKAAIKEVEQFSDTKWPNSIIIQLIEQDILGSVVVQRVILSFFFKGTFIGDFWCRFSILVANAIDTVTIAYRACTCKPTDQIFRPIVSWCQRDNTGDFDLTTKTITSTLVIDHSTASVRALKNLSSFYRLAYKFWRDCAQIGLKLQQVAIFAQQTLQRNSRQKLNHIDYLCRWPFRKI